MFTITLSDEQMIKIKVVDPDDFYNFVVDDFFRNHLLFQNDVWSSHFLNSNFELFKQSHMKKWPKWKLHTLMSFTTLMFTTFSF